MSDKNQKAVVVDIEKFQDIVCGLFNTPKRMMFPTENDKNTTSTKEKDSRTWSKQIRRIRKGSQNGS